MKTGLVKRQLIYKYLSISFTCTIFGSEQVAARSSGVRPFLSMALILDPLSSKVMTAWRWPWWQAQLKAVRPSLSVFLTSAPLINKLNMYSPLSLCQTFVQHLKQINQSIRNKSKRNTPLVRSSSMTPRWPSAAATIRAVRPTPSVWSTEAVDSCKSDSATSQWPSCTAQINAVTSYWHIKENIQFVSKWTDKQLQLTCNVPLDL